MFCRRSVSSSNSSSRSDTAASERSPPDDQPASVDLVIETSTGKNGYESLVWSQTFDRAVKLDCSRGAGKYLVFIGDLESGLV